MEENAESTAYDKNAISKFWSRFYLKTKTLPAHERRLQMRTAGTAVSIIANVRKYSFAELSLNLQLYERLNPSPEFLPQFQAQIELANIDYVKFFNSLHKFFNMMEKSIKGSHSIPTFFNFLKEALRVRQTKQCEDKKCLESIANSYIDLMMQMLSYLKADKYDFQHVIAGMDSHGNLLMIPDIYPNFDMMTFELMEMPPAQQTVAALRRIAKKYSLDIKNRKDCDLIESQDRNFTAIIDGLLPYIDETTIDILPRKSHQCTVEQIESYSTSTNLHALIRKLKSREKKLPPDGLLVGVNDRYFHTVFMRECEDHGQTIMLYRLGTEAGDLSGLFDAEREYFFSTVQGTGTLYARMVIESVVLLAYASGVLKDKEYEISMFGRRVSRSGVPVRASIREHAQRKNPASLKYDIVGS